MIRLGYLFGVLGLAGTLVSCVIVGSSDYQKDDIMRATYYGGIAWVFLVIGLVLLIVHQVRRRWKAWRGGTTKDK